MKNVCAMASLGVAFLAASVARAVEPAAIEGDYVEARTCDVWTGPCFANGEINLRGDCAVAAWAVNKGAWNGVALDGLAVVAVIRAEGTLHTESEGRVTAALFVDPAATDAQAQALAALARALAPERLAHAAAVERRPVSFARDGLAARLTVGSELTLRTERLGHGDAICCNEEQAYPAISGATDVVCVRAAEHAYRGTALGGVHWNDPRKRSAMVGTFAK